MSKDIERYPDPTMFDENLYNKILKLPCDKEINLEMVQTNIWSETKTFKIPKEKVIRGMQANMFIIDCINEEGDVKSVMVKRIVPEELPEKPSLEIWQGFVKSVRCEIDFYKDLLLPDHQSLGVRDE